jgi:thiamine biosynthesis lipoprotein
MSPTVALSAWGSLEDEARPIVTECARLMGGSVGVHVRPVPGDPHAEGAGIESARRDIAIVLSRIGVWADRLTRFSDDSDLMRLNAAPTAAAHVGPTLAAVLDWGRHASGITNGVVDLTLLAERLRAEFEPVATKAPSPPFGRDVRGGVGSGIDRSWTIRTGYRGATVVRTPGLRFDLDGIGKGWLADRAVALLGRYPAAVVDADGDIAISLDEGETWSIAIADPRDVSADLATLELAGLAPSGAQRFGVATSGTSIHEWRHADGRRHHLIDPQTGRPAVTDVTQATVLAGSAAEAEAFAKAIVIVGSEDALRLVDRPGLGGALLLTERGEVLATPSFTRWIS